MKYLVALNIVNISIHAAREGGDQLGKNLMLGFAISIHAAREGGDDIFVTRRECEEHFNPRRP